MRLYVLRHATTDNNVKNLINGRNDIDINNRGIKEAGVASLILKDFKFDQIYCSPLLRAKHTMQIVNSNNFPVIYDERITERDAGVMTNKEEKELNLNIWDNPNVGIVYGGSESFKEVLNRVDNFLKEIQEKHKDDTVLLVTHGGVMKAIETIMFGYPGIDEIINWRYPNCIIKTYKL